MKTLGKSLTVDSRFSHLYRPLIKKLLIVLALTLVIATAVVIYFDARMVRSMSNAVIRNATNATTENLQRMVNSNRDALVLAQEQVANSELDDPESRQDLVDLLIPFLATYSTLDSINFADADGNEIAVLREDSSILTRQILETEPETANWQRINDGVVAESWQRKVAVPVTERPWFEGAMDHVAGERYWTAPYKFLTTRDIGVSVTTRWRDDAGGADKVLAFNVNLAQISRVTTELHPSENGLSLIFDAAGNTFGLPGTDHFKTDEAIRAALLQPASELGIPQVSAAIEEWNNRQQDEKVFDYHLPSGERWWAGFSRIAADADHELVSAVLVPQSDLLGPLRTLRNLSLAGIALLGALIGAGVLAVAMRHIRRQMQGAVDMVEKRLGQYHIEQKIGQGGNGSVFRARHALLRRPTALKLMSPAFAGSEAARDRFEHEVQLTSSLSHPNTIAIYDFGRTADGTLYYAMELLNGSTLERLVRGSGPLPANRAIYLLLQACGSLAEAHDRGLIHRDVKPSNMIVCERGGLYDVVKVLDFGLVKEIAESEGDLTQTDLIVGTPFYMAPETIRKAGTAGPQSDLYALGAVGYFLLTGTNVFEGASAVEICSSHLHDEPVPPSVRLGCPVPADLERIILDCLAKDPADRPADALELAARLAQCADAGTWTQEDARDWWGEYGQGLSAVAVESETPMSRTELLIDLDTRLEQRQ